jgi:hypothetical protein
MHGDGAAFAGFPESATSSQCVAEVEPVAESGGQQVGVGRTSLTVWCFR